MDVLENILIGFSAFGFIFAIFLAVVSGLFRW